jgi:hypothetical protein
VLVGGKKPTVQYMVEVEPEEGSGIGKWGGSGNVDAEGTLTFTHIPPGRYAVVARPNPGSVNDTTPRVIAEIEPGETAEVILEAK